MYEHDVDLWFDDNISSKATHTIIRPTQDQDIP